MPAFALSSFQCIEEISPLRVGNKYFYIKSTFGSTALVKNCCNKVTTLVDAFTTYMIKVLSLQYNVLNV